MATTREAAAALVTNRHARAALGIAAANLRRGYQTIDAMRPESWGPFVAGGIFGDAGKGDVRQSATELLDQSNAYAVRLYGQIPDTDDPLDEGLRPQILEALNEASSNLSLLESVATALVDTFLDDLGELVNAIAEATVAAAQWIGDKAKQIVSAVVPAWVWWVLGGAVVAAAVVAAARVTPGRVAA